MLKSNDFFRITLADIAKNGKEQGDDYASARIYDDVSVAVLCDGVGSALAGREAALRTVDALLKNFKVRPNSWTILESLATFISSINHILYQESKEQYNYTELVTTLAIVVINKNKLYGANVGDSRVYVKREEQLVQLSKDHNLDQKDMTHVLTKAIGLSDEVEPYFFEYDLVQNDKVMLCSDGLYNELNNENLLNGIALGASALVKSAVQKHSPTTMPDDTTAVVIEVLSFSDKPKEEDVHKLEIPEQLKAGDIIDGYTLLEPLIQNNRTWKVRRLNASFVMKFAPIEAKEDIRIDRQFVKEVWNAKRLKAGFFVKAIVPKNRTKRYYIMSYIEGHTLKEHIKKKPLSVDETIELGLFLLKASQFLAKYNLVHGDIKPENIMVSKRDNKQIYKLIDFGSIVESFALDTKAGTASYLAPERFNATAICEQTEIYAIGVTLYESMTKKFPYGEIEAFQTPSFSKSVKAPMVLNKNVPNWLNAVVLRSIAKDVDLRYTHYSEMMFDIEHPDAVKPFFTKESSFLEKNPLKFYQIGFGFSLIVNFIAVILLLR